MTKFNQPERSFSDQIEDWKNKQENGTEAEWREPIVTEMDESPSKSEDTNIASFEDEKLSEDISLSLNKTISSNTFDNNDDDSKLLSSSLREALKMLREED